MRKISTKILMILLVMSCLSVLFALLISYITVKDTIKKQASTTGIAVAEYNAEKIEIWAREKITSLERTALHISNVDVFDYKKIQKMLGDAVVADSSFYSIFIGLEDGELIDANGWKPPENYNVIERPWYEEAIKKNDSIVSTIYVDKNMNTKVYSIAMPIAIDNKKGVLAANLRIEKILDIFENIEYGKTGYGILVNQEGIIIAHPQKQYILESIEEVLEDKNMIYQIINDYKTGVKAISIDNKEQLLVHVPLNSCEWKFLLLAPLSEFQDPANQMLRYLILLLGTFIVATLVLGLMLGKSMSKSIEKIIRSVSRLAKGDLTEDIQIQTKDEFQILSDELNKMRNNLLTMLKEVEDDSNLLFMSSRKLLDSIGDNEELKLESKKEFQKKNPMENCESIEIENSSNTKKRSDNKKKTHKKQKQLAGAEEVYMIAEEINDTANKLKQGIRSFKV